MRTLILAMLLCLGCAAQNLKVYAIDVEGGKATLYVSPSGESMLLDTGYDGNNGRDAERIAAAARDARVKQIDYLVITHYHADHLGGVAQLAARLPIRNFVDHGPSVETMGELYKTYTGLRSKGNHIVVEGGRPHPNRRAAGGRGYRSRRTHRAARARRRRCESLVCELSPHEGRCG